MPEPKFSSLFLRLSRDEELRRKFAENPKGFLSAEGFDPEQLDLPSNIDIDSLNERVEKAFEGARFDWTASETEIEAMGADELWGRFGVISQRDDETGIVVSTATPVVAVVVYGTSVVTSVGATLAFERARTIRKMMELRKSDLTFSVKGPEGVAVDDLPAATIEALLRRLD